MKSPEEIRRIVTKYPPKWRRWCDGPEQGGCACAGCVRTPPPDDYPGLDPEGRPFRNPGERLTREEMQLWLRETSPYEHVQEEKDGSR